MKRIVIFVLIVGGLGLSVYGLRDAYQAYHSWPLEIYLALFVFLPMLNAIATIGYGGVEGFKQTIRSLAIATVGLVITTLVYKFLTQNWLWSCLAGAFIPAVVMIAIQWRIGAANVMSSQAVQLLNNGNYSEALSLSTSAREVFVSRNNRDGQALSSYHIGIAYSGLGDGLRAARYLNSSLAMYQALGNVKMVETVTTSLNTLAQRGIDISISQTEVETKSAFIRWDHTLASLLLSASLAGLAYLWGVKAWTTSIPVLVSCAALLFYFLIGNFAVGTKVAQQSERSRTSRSLWLFNLFFILFVPTFGAWMLVNKYVTLKSFPVAFRDELTSFDKLISTLPSGIWLWVSIVIIVAFLLLMFPANWFQNVIVGFGREDAVELQALGMAKQYIEEKQWGRAITQLSRIDLTKDRDVASKVKILFLIAYVQAMADHHVEALQYLHELFEIDAKYLPGLYLAGYITLSKNELDRSEEFWRRLYSLSPSFRPTGTGGADKDVRYYLSLTLYRKAMACIDKDPDQSAKLLSEVGKLESLDQFVANALVRVHLYRCVQLIRVRQWNEAAQELALANQKQQQIQSTIQDKTELAKIQSLCQAAEGLILFRQEKYKESGELFGSAQDSVKELSVKKPLFSGGQSFFEEVLKSMMAEAEGKGKLPPSYVRDLHFLTGLGHLRLLYESTQHSKRVAWKNNVALLEKNFEDSLSTVPEFMEGRAMLGLIYFYLSEDPQKQLKGIEMLRSVQERVGSPFVIKTINEFESDQKRRVDAQKAYFDVLQQYMQFSNVPLQQRKTLREKFLEKMKETGQDQEFMGRGGLELESEREHEPSVQEYLMRSALLKEKITQLVELDRTGKLPAADRAQIEELIKSLNERNQELQEHVKQISSIEHDLLLAAQKYI